MVELVLAVVPTVVSVVLAVVEHITVQLVEQELLVKEPTVVMVPHQLAQGVEVPVLLGLMQGQMLPQQEEQELHPQYQAHQ